MTAPDRPSDYLTTAQAAAHLNVSASTFRRRVAPNVPALVMGAGRARYYRGDLDEWFHRNARAPKGKAIRFPRRKGGPQPNLDDVLAAMAAKRPA